MVWAGGEALDADDKGGARAKNEVAAGASPIRPVVHPSVGVTSSKRGLMRSGPWLDAASRLPFKTAFGSCLDSDVERFRAVLAESAPEGPA